MTEPKTEAELLTERTGKAIAWTVQQWGATDLAEVIDSLGVPEEPTRKQVFLEDVTDTFFRALSYAAANTYALCILQSEHEEAGKTYRSDDVQAELRQMAKRITTNVISKP